MAKRGYKLQEFVAHSGNVNCLRFGKKTCRLFLTGGDDQNVNLWSIGKPTPAASLSGHTSPVESVAFNSAEVQVLAGASSGVIKLWDLEETKMVRTLTGHRSYCTACEFHPFGEFFASGSMDTNLKLWDIRKKGSIHTYKGHTRGISNIRFTPDGRWVVSGGFDNVVKVWDLTAGKLLHDFKFHEGHIRSMDFHPLEFLLATGSADRTVKFWDLETFEMIGSTRREAAGVRSITFHPDGRSLFCGLDDCLKVYSWEPVICHDSVEMGWSTLSDLCIHDGKLLGGAYYQNSVGVWVADISLIEPYGAGLTPERKSNLEQKQEHVPCHLGRVGSNRSSDSSLRCTSPDVESDEIKNIYVDCENPVTIKKVTSRSPKAVPPSDSKEINTQSSLKPNSVIGVPAKTNGLSVDKSFVVPGVVPRDIPDGKNLDPSRRESISATRASAGMPQKTFHIQRPSNNKVDMEKVSVVLESGSADNLADAVDCKELNIDSRLMTDNNAKDCSQGNDSIVKYDGEKLEKTSAQAPQNNQENCNGSLECGKGLKAVRVVNGVAVVRGRTRSLVERFEKREGLNMDDVHKPDTVSHSKAEEAEISPLPPSCCKDEEPETSPFTASQVLAKEATCPLPPAHSEVEEAKVCTSPDSYSVAEELEASPMPATQFKVEEVRALHLPASRPKAEPLKASPVPASQLKSEYPRKSRLPASRSKPEVLEVSPMPGSQFKAEAKTSRLSAFRSKSEEAKISRLLASRSKLEEAHKYRVLSYSSKVEEAHTASLPNTDQQTVARVKSAQNDDNVIEDLMQSHDVLLSAFRSRLTKLQVVRHFWERNDVKGAINALRKLPDCAVQADVVSVLLERMELINLDLFSCLLPVLLSLLDSKVERHANVSLEMLIKLVAVFGPVVRSAVSARPSVGVDLHAEERILCCRQCLVHLQNIQKILPALARRGGLLAKGALQLNLLLQES